MNVFLLGAGASKAYTNSKYNISMPMAKDFFQTFLKLDISSNPYVLIGDLVNYIRDNYGIKVEDFYSFNMDIEEVHSVIYEKLIKILTKYDGESPHVDFEFINYFKPHQQLLFLFNSVINEIQNSEISEAHIKLSDYINDDDVIITFNWDTLIDRVLCERKNWNCETGYYVRPQAVYDDNWIKNLQTDNSTPLLLKLHGSTNWLTGYFRVTERALRPNQIMSYDTFFVYKNSTKVYPTYRGRYFDGYQPFSYGYYPVNIQGKEYSLPNGHNKVRLKMNYDSRVVDEDKPNEDGIVSMPIIIPPVKSKEYDMYGSLFEQLWLKAEETLTYADKIYIIGYSFPRTDTKTSELFKKAFSKRKKMPYIYIINPYPENIRDKFIFEYGIDYEHLVVIKEYFTTNFDFKLFK